MANRHRAKELSSFAGRNRGQVPTVQVKGELGVKMVQLARNAYSENGRPRKNEKANN